MKRWRGWGGEDGHYSLAEDAESYLRQEVGSPQQLQDTSLEDCLSSISPSRMRNERRITTDAMERLSHSHGQSLPDWVHIHGGNINPVPDGVVYPENGADVRALMDYCQKESIVLIPYGGGSSVLGHINPLRDDRPVLTMDLTRMDHLTDLDTISHLATLEAGATGPHVEAQLAEHGYTLGHFPQSFEYSTVGGWIATRSVGQQSHHYGRIDQMLVSAEMETFSGTLRTARVPASAAGPDINQILLGSEGRIGIITSAVLRVHPLPEKEQFLAAFMPDWQCGVECAREIVQNEIPVSMLRLSDATETTTTLKLSGKERLVKIAEDGLRLIGIGDGRCLLIYGMTGSTAHCRLVYQEVNHILRKYRGFSVNPVIGPMWQKTRFKTPYLRNTLWKKGYALDTLETCLPWSKVPNAVAAIKEALKTGIEGKNERALIFAHLSHLYEEGASMYITYLWRRDADPEITLERWRAMKWAASDVISESGGTISHQHGVGTDHAPWLAREKSASGMQLLKGMIHQMDPHGLLNPGKLIGDR